MNIAFSIPVTIIGGYLGSGKTTLVNHLLRNANGARLAVLVNDFGELPIDADLIREQTGDVISLTGGCVCCSYGDDLTTALIDLQNMDPLPDHIVIEASGVALPAPIGGSLSLQRKLRLHSIIVIADASTIQSHAQDKYLADTIERQLAGADLILINKHDLVSDAQSAAVEHWLATHNPHARLLNVVNSVVDPEVILDTARASLKSTELTELQDAKHVHDPAIFQTVEITIKNNVDANALAEKLSAKHCALVRAKGFVTDTDGTRKILQIVGQRWSVTDAPAGDNNGIVCIGKSGEFSEQSVRQYCDL